MKLRIKSVTSSEYNEVKEFNTIEELFNWQEKIGYDVIISTINEGESNEFNGEKYEAVLEIYNGYIE